MAKIKDPWEEVKDELECGKVLKETFDSVMEEQSPYRGAMLTHMRLYRNLNSMVYLTPSQQSVATLSAPLSLNVVRNMVNAVHSKITKHRVKTTFQTSGASYEMREKARKLDAYGLGLIQKEQLFKQTPLAFLDCAVLGTGVMKTVPLPSRKRVCFQRVFSPNLVVDMAEGMFLTPAHYYEISYPDRSMLAKKYPDKRDALEAAASASETDDEFFVFSESPSADLVQVITAHYFESDNETNGMRVTILGSTGAVLERTAVSTGDIYSTMRWSTSNLGWYGMGLGEELKGIQLEINRLLRKIQMSFSLLANPYILADRASAIARGQLTDIAGSVILYNGKEPKVNAPQTVHPEVFAHLDRLYQRAYEISGMSQLSVSGQAPKQFESGRALLVHEDIESDRFAAVHREWDELHVDCVRKAIRAARSIPGYKVHVWGQDNMEVLDFRKDIDLGEDEWMIRPLPTAFLGETTQAQLDNAERMAKSGLIPDPSELLEQVTAPDIAAYVKRVTSPKKWIESTISHMLQGGEFVSPEPEMNLAMCLDLAQSMYSQMRLVEGFPPERLANVRRFMTRTKDLLKLAASTAPPTMGATSAPGGPPPIPGAEAPPPPPAAPAMTAPAAA